MSTWNPGSVPPLPSSPSPFAAAVAAKLSGVAPGSVDAAGVLQIDLACRRCSYNLRGLKDSGVCPECAAPVGRSLQGDLLRFADPDWVDRLALGGRLIMIGLTLSILLGLCGGALVAMAGVATTTTTTTTGPGLSYTASSTSMTSGFWPQFLANALLLPAWLVTLYGAWLITTRDPSGLGEERYALSRKLVRIGVVAALANAALNTLSNLIPWLRNNPLGGVTPALILFGMLGGLLQLVAAICGLAYLKYLSKLADRVPDPDLTAFGQRVYGFALFVAGLFVLMVLLIIALLLAPGGVSPGAPPGSTGTAALVGLGIVGCAASVLGFVLFLMYVWFQHRCGQTFREQARLARATWAGAVPVARTL